MVNATAVERKSGSLTRIIDILAPFGGEAEMRGQVGLAETSVSPPKG